MQRIFNVSPTGWLRQPVFNCSRRKVGGIWFVKLGRVNISFCVSRPKTIHDVQAMRWTTWRAARNMDEVYRALRARHDELAQHGAAMEVNLDH